MKLMTIITAATLTAASLAIPAAAQAQPGPDHHDRGWHGDRGHDRGWNGRGYRYGHGYRHHPRCWTEWHHHRAFRVCR